MAACTACGSQMLPLFTGLFCPRDCDRRERTVAGVQPERWDLEVVLGGSLWRFRRLDASREKIPLIATHGSWPCGSWDMQTPLQKVNRHLRLDWSFRSYPKEFHVESDGIVAINHFGKSHSTIHDVLASFWRVEP